MREYKINHTNKLFVKQGKIEEEKGDAVVCWSSIDLKHGPDSFYKIHKKAGSQVMGSIALFEPYLKFGSAFTSIAGLLDFYIIIHSIMPIHPGMYNDSFFNIIRTIKKYKELDICRDLYMSIPVSNKKLIIDHLLTYTELLNNFSFYIIVESEKEYSEIISILDQCLNSSWFSKVITLFKTVLNN